jgi:methyltransferase-like protein
MSDPREKVNRARAYLHFLIESTSERESAYVEVLKWEQKILERVPDTYIFHEHLEDVNQPLYFHQFAERAQASELQFISEARFHSEVSTLQPDVLAKLNVLKQERLEYEQQIDFLTNATFRRSLICHKDVKLLTEPDPLAIMQMHMTTRVTPVNTSVDFHPQVQAEFRDHDDALISTTHPLVKAAIVCLAEVRPQFMSFDSLYETAISRLATAIPHETFDRSRELLASALFRCHHNNLIEVKLTPPRHTHNAGQNPRTTRLARWQAAQQESISNLQHRVVQLNEVERFVLSLLDGSRDIEQLQKILTQQINSGVIVLEKGGRAVQTSAEIATVVNTTIALCLQKYAGLFLLCDE